MKLCNKCGVEKEVSKFYAQSSTSDGLQHWCKECHTNYSKTHYANNKNKRKETNKAYYLNNKEKYYLRNYGITLDEYNKMYDDQKGCCKICGEHQDSFSINFAVDHCHTTGKVRGLLCSNCNRGVGYLKDSTTILQSAIDYLKEHQYE